MLVKVEEMFGDKLCPPPPQDAVCVCNLILSKIKKKKGNKILRK